MKFIRDAGETLI